MMVLNILKGQCGCWCLFLCQSQRQTNSWSVFFHISAGSIGIISREREFIPSPRLDDFFDKAISSNRGSSEVTVQ